jgi:hypothetical protein
MKRYQAAPPRLDSHRATVSRSGDIELSRFLTNVGQFEPLTFPELLELLPDKLQTRGKWRLVIARHRQVVLWDGLSETAARELARLFETGKLALQPCNSALYDLSSRRVDLPAVSSMPALPHEERWLTCTIGRGPAMGLCCDWTIGYGTDLPSN